MRASGLGDTPQSVGDLRLKTNPESVWLWLPIKMRALLGPTRLHNLDEKGLVRRSAQGIGVTGSLGLVASLDQNGRTVSGHLHDVVTAFPLRRVCVGSTSRSRQGRVERCDQRRLVATAFDDSRIETGSNIDPPISDMPRLEPGLADSAVKHRG